MSLMAEPIVLNPNPKSHIKTLCRIGYTLNSSIGDIVDNSIAAGARNIWIESRVYEENLELLIMDDGHGMSPPELIENMRLSCKDPSDTRSDDDLGRFGSGLKTASFSQARVLTVISKTEGTVPSGATWNLNVVEDKNSWELLVNSFPEIERFCLQPPFDKVCSGTMVVWREIGKYRDIEQQEVYKSLLEDLSNLSRYLGLYFHKFLQSKSKKVEMYVNRTKVEPIDPFLRGITGYQEGPAQSYRVRKGGKIEIKVHILPHESKIPTETLISLGGADAITAKQGLYVYRSGRLIIDGGWQGLTRLSQLGKLARVEINVPSSLDEEWGTDVKKSSLEIPEKVKSKLRILIQHPIEKSKRAYRYRGKVDEANSYWNVKVNDRSKKVSYELNIDNEQLEDLLSKMPNQETSKLLVDYLKGLSTSLPLNSIYEKLASDPRAIDQENLDFDSLYKDISRAWTTSNN